MTGQKSLREKILEIVAGTLLALAGAATSWSGYQAALWGGIESENYSRAITLRLESSLAEAEANQMRMIDAGLFAQWLDAHAAANKELEDFYRARFRPEFNPAFDAWIASRPLQDKNALPSPLAQPEYRLSFTQKSQALEAQGTQTFQKALDANLKSDNYVLTTVIFGLVMFFAGISQQFESRPVKTVLLGIAFLMAAAALDMLIVYPVAQPG